MNLQTRKSLERVVDQLERSQRRSSRRITPASLALAAGFFLAFMLLTRVIPSVWPVLLGGDPDLILRGWPRFVWRASLLCMMNEAGLLGGLAVASLVVLALTYRIRLLRPIVWLAALGMAALNAAILGSTILACLDAASRAG